MAYNLNADILTSPIQLLVAPWSYFWSGSRFWRCGVFLEERKTKQISCFLTAPVSLTKVVLGKYFAMVTVPGSSECDLLPVPAFWPNSRWERHISGRLQLHCGILPLMCVSGDRDVYVVSDREPDHCIYQYCSGISFCCICGTESCLFCQSFGAQRNRSESLWSWHWSLFIFIIWRKTGCLRPELKQWELQRRWSYIFVKSSLYENLWRSPGTACSLRMSLWIFRPAILWMSADCFCMYRYWSYLYFWRYRQFRKGVGVRGARYAEN